MSDIQRVLKAVDEIEHILRDSSYGWKNEEAARNLEGQVRIIRREIGSMAYIDEKLGSLVDWTDKLYSARKWMRWGTAEQVRHLALMDCEKIKMYLPTITDK